jgi:hypothetical protein
MAGAASRFRMHFTPTSSSWMNLVERFFGELTAFISERSFASTRELADAIISFLAARNEKPQRYVWKAKGEDILRKSTPQGAHSAHNVIIFQRQYTRGVGWLVIW